MRSKGNCTPRLCEGKGNVMDHDSVVKTILASIILLGSMILAGNKLFNPINDLAAATAVQPTPVNMDLASLDASLESGNYRSPTGELAESAYEAFRAIQALEEGNEEQVRLSSAEERQQPNTQMVGTNVAPFVNKECEQPIQKALDMERVLGKIANPEESIWVTEYCGYRQQMWDNQCYVPNDYLYYEELCKK